MWVLPTSITNSIDSTRFVPKVQLHLNRRGNPASTRHQKWRMPLASSQAKHGLGKAPSISLRAVALGFALFFPFVLRFIRLFSARALLFPVPLGGSVQVFAPLNVHLDLFVQLGIIQLSGLKQLLDLFGVQGFLHQQGLEIGRASCRARVDLREVAVSEI